MIPEKIKIAFLNTPIYKLERISEVLGKNIYIKRDDFHFLMIPIDNELLSKWYYYIWMCNLIKSKAAIIIHIRDVNIEWINNKCTDTSIVKVVKLMHSSISTYFVTFSV